MDMFLKLGSRPATMKKLGFLSCKGYKQVYLESAAAADLRGVAGLSNPFLFLIARSIPGLWGMELSAFSG